MPVRSVVGDDVDDDPDPGGLERRDQLVEVVDGPQSRVHGTVVVDVVPAVGERGGIERAEPHRINAERGEIWHARGHPGEVADSVAVRVGEAARVDLVHDGVGPPGRVHVRVHVWGFLVVLGWLGVIP